MKVMCKNRTRCSMQADDGCEYYASCICFVGELPKPSKYRNIKTEVDGITFDSKLEAKRYQELKLLEKANKIFNLRLQVKFPLTMKTEKQRATYYVADFVYVENGKLVVEDTKSKATRTPLYRLKKKLMYERYKIEIKEIF